MHPPWPQRQHRRRDRHQVELQHLLLRCGSAPDQRCLRRLCLQAGLGPAHRRGGQRGAGPPDHQERLQLHRVAGRAGRHRPGQHGGHAYPAGDLCRHAGQPRHPLPHPLRQGHSRLQHWQDAGRDPAGGHGCRRRQGRDLRPGQGRDAGGGPDHPGIGQLSSHHRLQDRQPPAQRGLLCGQHL